MDKHVKLNKDRHKLLIKKNNECPRLFAEFIRRAAMAYMIEHNLEDVHVTNIVNSIVGQTSINKNATRTIEEEGVDAFIDDIVDKLNLDGE